MDFNNVTQEYPLGVLDLPYGVTVVWPTFGAEPWAKITFKLVLAFPEHFSKPNVWLTTKLDLYGP